MEKQQSEIRLFTSTIQMSQESSRTDPYSPMFGHIIFLYFLIFFQALGLNQLVLWFVQVFVSAFWCLLRRTYAFEYAVKSRGTLIGEGGREREGYEKWVKKTRKSNKKWSLKTNRAKKTPKSKKNGP